MVGKTLLLCFLSSLLASAYGNDCPSHVPQDKYRIYEDKCLLFVNDTFKTFKDAEQVCEQEGGNLVTIDSEGAHTFIKKALYKISGPSSYTEFWIGLRYDNKTGFFVWEDKKTLGFEFNALDYSARNTLKSRGDGCVSVHAAGKDWTFHQPCEGDIYRPEKKHLFICEYPRMNLPPKPEFNWTEFEQKTKCRPSLQTHQYNDVKVFDQKCYTFGHWLLNYEDAKQNCKVDGGKLAMPKTKAINDFLQRELTQNYRLLSVGVWIGLRYNAEHDAFRWEDGTPMNYTNFRHGHTRHFDFWDCVAMIPSSGKWLDYKCQGTDWQETEQRRFVCEHPFHSTWDPEDDM